MNFTKSMRKYFCLSMLAIFGYSIFSPSYAEASIWEQRRQSLKVSSDIKERTSSAFDLTLPKQKNLIKNFFPFELPPELGSVTETWSPLQSLKGAPLVIHIQDAHGNYAAQKNTSKILKYLVNQKALRSKGKALPVYIEGASNAVNAQWLRLYPKPEVRQQTAELLLKSGLLMGEEYFSFDGEQALDISIEGLENQKIYQANLNTRRLVSSYRQDIVNRLSEIEGILNAKKSELFNKDLMQAETMSANFENGSISATDYAKSLQTQINLKTYPNLILLLESAQKEKVFEAKKLQSFSQNIVKELTQRLDSESLKNFSARSLEFRLGRLAAADYYEMLLKLTQSYGINGGDLSAYVVYLRQAQSVDSLGLMQELSRAQEVVLGSSLSKQLKGKNTESAIELYRMSRLLSIEKKFWTEKFAPADWLVYQRSLKFNANQARALNALEEYCGLSSIEGLPQESDLRFLQESYYKLAFRRDQVLSQNLLAKVRSGTAVFIAGGFHSDGVLRHLRERNVPYVVIRPSLETSQTFVKRAKTTPDQSSYEDALRLELRLARKQKNEAYAQKLEEVLDLQKNLVISDPVLNNGKYEVIATFKKFGEDQRLKLIFETESKKEKQLEHAHLDMLRLAPHSLENAAGIVAAQQAMEQFPDASGFQVVPMSSLQEETNIDNAIENELNAYEISLELTDTLASSLHKFVEGKSIRLQLIANAIIAPIFETILLFASLLLANYDVLNYGYALGIFGVGFILTHIIFYALGRKFNTRSTPWGYKDILIISAYALFLSAPIILGFYTFGLDINIENLTLLSAISLGLHMLINWVLIEKTRNPRRVNPRNNQENIPLQQMQQMQQIQRPQAQRSLTINHSTGESEDTDQAEAATTATTAESEFGFESESEFGFGDQVVSQVTQESTSAQLQPALTKEDHLREINKIIEIAETANVEFTDAQQLKLLEHFLQMLSLIDNYEANKQDILRILTKLGHYGNLRLIALMNSYYGDYGVIPKPKDLDSLEGKIFKINAIIEKFTVVSRDTWTYPTALDLSNAFVGLVVEYYSFLDSYAELSITDTIKKISKLFNKIKEINDNAIDSNFSKGIAKVRFSAAVLTANSQKLTKSLKKHLNDDLQKLKELKANETKRLKELENTSTKSIASSAIASKPKTDASLPTTAESESEFGFPDEDLNQAAVSEPSTVLPQTYDLKSIQSALKKFKKSETKDQKLILAIYKQTEEINRLHNQLSPDVNILTIKENFNKIREALTLLKTQNIDEIRENSDLRSLVLLADQYLILFESELKKFEIISSAKKRYDPATGAILNQKPPESFQHKRPTGQASSASSQGSTQAEIDQAIAALPPMLARIRIGNFSVQFYKAEPNPVTGAAFANGNTIYILNENLTAQDISELEGHLQILANKNREELLAFLQSDQAQELSMQNPILNLIFHEMLESLLSEEASSKRPVEIVRHLLANLLFETQKDVTNHLETLESAFPGFTIEKALRDFILNKVGLSFNSTWAQELLIQKALEVLKRYPKLQQAIIVLAYANKLDLSAKAKERILSVATNIFNRIFPKESLSWQQELDLVIKEVQEIEAKTTLQLNLKPTFVIDLRNPVLSIFYNKLLPNLEENQVVVLVNQDQEIPESFSKFKSIKIGNLSELRQTSNLIIFTTETSQFDQKDTVFDLSILLNIGEELIISQAGWLFDLALQSGGTLNADGTITLPAAQLKQASQSLEDGLATFIATAISQ